MISDKMKDALNEQLNKEIFSSYLYLAMSAYFEDKNLKGMATWMKYQSDEENIHAMKFYNYILKVGSRVKLGQIDEPEFEWESPKAAFEAAYAHEQFITKSINTLVDVAIEEKDHATVAFLQWFVDEQVEEEATADEIVKNFEMVGNEKSGLFMLERELGQRPAPSTTVE